MIPIQLTIEGLYSYQNRQTIDFNHLIEAGLFGIFGAVGSGKSSILEAITFALYGNSDRLGATNFAYNMMNLKSNKLYIEFEFYNYENKRFKIVREYKRNGKNFDKIVNSGAVLYEFINEDWLPLNHLDTEQVIGLSSENFRRTIIIPQGKFKEFIELKSTARTQMMKEIFDLHRFDLQDKVASIVKKNQSEIDQLEGKLSGFEEVSEEHISIVQTQFKVEKEAANQIQQQYDIVNERFQQLKALKLDFENLKQKKIAFEQLATQKVEMDQRKKQLEQYELIFTTFNQLLINQTKVQKEIIEKESITEDQKKQLVLIENQIKEVTKQLKEIQNDFEALPTKRKEENDLELIVQILNFSKEIQQLKERTKNGLLKVEEVKKKENSIEKEIKSLEQDLKSLTENKIDSTILMEVGNWFNQNQIIQQSINKQELKVKDLTKEIEALKQELVEQNINIDSFEKDFISKFEELEQMKSALENQKNEIEVKQKMSEYVHNLHDGKPCPLCGSENHPSVVEIEDVTTQLEQALKDLKQVLFAIDNLRKKQQFVQTIINKKQLFEEQIKAEELTISEHKKQFKIHQELFVWKELDSTNFSKFEELRLSSIAIEQSISAKNKELIRQRELLETARKNVEQFQKLLEDIRVDEIEKASQIKQNISNLRVLNFSDFDSKSVDEVQSELEQLKDFNEKIEQDFSRFSQHLTDLNLKLTARKTALEALEKQIIELKANLRDYINQIDYALEKHKINSIEIVHQTLGLNLDIPKIRQELEDFRVKFETLKNAITELEQKLAKVSFDENLYQKTEEEVTLILQQLKAANDVVSKLEAEILRLQNAYEAKKELLKVFEQLQKRATNLKTLQAMFKSAGFVNYVSSIYLKQLCENANVRFHRMTKNQLSLQLNEDNDFEIIDYLNEGRARSVKTLSGGQAFQVSLSLALALAESVQSSSKADRNFFFIDEGFGTQDADAVNIVFETLNHLHKENRIVGIISHVEELKERIPMALNVIKDEENGSKIIF